MSDTQSIEIAICIAITVILLANIVLFFFSKRRLFQIFENWLSEPCSVNSDTLNQQLAKAKRELTEAKKISRIFEEVNKSNCEKLNEAKKELVRVNRALEISVNALSLSIEEKAELRTEAVTYKAVAKILYSALHDTNPHFVEFYSKHSPENLLKGYDELHAKNRNAMNAAKAAEVDG